ncbi:pimeloyl-ACP methyl ester carboxylesterase [Sphingomonas naasensis]|uniref:Alpha/beta hydrolase n=1 Tax=Sphingomonas naasensis TaxID=1344951 RepID=A0A4S1WRZ2_9SPHN|nr:alpha/beta hydrolase [Sphingomonas naasensis]NIJ18953.1 pimeloyl-ACP methyl ester carboxylesterase [Sphingomonas naasensis]TGX46168.1 alpha/beta hydrolase [Sphingomonas naasensis]
MGERRNYTDGFWWSKDGLRLHYRDYAGADDRPPVLCFPGLTRNARDYDGLASRLAGARRVLCIEFRGRGESAYAKDPMSYVPLTYLQDVEALLADLGITRFVAVGTSLGGIVTMLLAATDGAKIAGAVLNDVGPELDPGGLARIRSYVGKAVWHPTWMHAARALAENNADVYPGYGIEDWLRMAKRLYRVNSSGRIVLDYDMKIAEPFRVPGNEAGPDMWPTIDAMQGKPLLIVRGERSDILGAATADKMVARVKGAELVTVPGVGHAPTLDEPEVVEAIERLLAKVA